MSFDQAVQDKLAAPLDAQRIRHREGGGGRSLSYLEGHDVIRAANEIFGVGEWGYVVQDLTCLGEEPVDKTYNGQTKQGVRVAYRALVNVSVNGTAYSDVGFGDAVEYTGSHLAPHELASKEAVTDGLKRALKNLGDQFGLCLYDKAYVPAQSAGEQRGAVSSPAEGSTAPTPNGEFRFASGKHEGKSLAEAPLDYVKWYSENGPKQDVKALCAGFLSGGDIGAFVDDDPDGIPFRPSIDGVI